MRVFLLLPLLLLGIFELSAKEFKNKKEYTYKTGGKVIHNRHWLKEHRENNTREWKAACLYNFSYEKGFKEFTTLDERADHLKWLCDTLAKKGHKVLYPRMLREITLSLKDASGKKINYKETAEDFAVICNDVVFDNMYERLQELFQQTEILEGAEATEWDKESIRYEQEEVLQPIYDKLGKDVLEELNEIKYRRKNFYTGRFKVGFIEDRKDSTTVVESSDDRIAYEQEDVLEYTQQLVDKENAKKKVVKQKPTIRETVEQMELPSEVRRQEREEKKVLKRREKYAKRDAMEEKLNEDRKRFWDFEWVLRKKDKSPEPAPRTLKDMIENGN